MSTNENVTEPAPAAARATPSKAAAVIKLLSRGRGASMAEMGSATDWQPHSVRAFLSGLRKKGTLLVREERKDGERAYRITKGVATCVGTEA